MTSHRRPYRPHRQEFARARYRRRTIFEAAKSWVHEHTPRLGIRLDDFLP